MEGWATWRNHGWAWEGSNILTSRGTSEKVSTGKQRIIWTNWRCTWKDIGIDDKYILMATIDNNILEWKILRLFYKITLKKFASTSRKGQKNRNVFVILLQSKRNSTPTNLSSSPLLVLMANPHKKFITNTAFWEEEALLIATWRNAWGTQSWWRRR